MNFCFNAPLNSVSFGQVATHLLRGFFRNNISPSIYPIGGQVDLSSQSVDEKFKSSLEDCIKKFLALHDRNTACLKLWHLNGAIDSPSKTTNLLVSRARLPDKRRKKRMSKYGQDIYYVQLL